MIVGFTGTQDGITQAQRDSLLRLLQYYTPPRSLVHGDCVGADATAHEIAQALKYRIHIRPPSNTRKRAWCIGGHTVYEAEPYLKRNHKIVDQSDELIACPHSTYEILRSGTWATIRYARKIGKPVVIIYPDGSTDQT